MVEITDEFMLAMREKTKSYSFVLLKSGPNWATPGADKVIWEHGRRNHALRAEGVLSIVCPIRDESEVHGIGIFNADLDAVREIMDEDPGVKAGIFVYELHPCRSFPGDALPA